METTEEQTENKLQSQLSGLLNTDGSWNSAAVEALAPNLWTEWFKRRLAGSDPHFGYDREDRATHPGHLFRSLFRKLSELDSPNTTNAAKGLAQYLGSLNPSTANATELREAIDLVLHVRPRYTLARNELSEILRAWIDEELLLHREGDSVAPETLQRKALFALAALQYPGGEGPNGERNDDEDIETFRDWLDDPDVAEAAFSGLCLALASTPEPGVVSDFLERCDDVGIHPQRPLETLVIDRQNGSEIRTYLWDEIQVLDESEERWEELRQWLEDEFYLPSYNLMQARNRRPTVPPLEDEDNSPPSEQKGPTWTSSFDSLQEPA
jgi:hypothetical protein